MRKTQWLKVGDKVYLKPPPLDERDMAPTFNDEMVEDADGEEIFVIDRLLYDYGKEGYYEECLEAFGEGEDNGQEGDYLIKSLDGEKQYWVWHVWVKPAKKPLLESASDMDALYEI